MKSKKTIFISIIILFVIIAGAIIGYAVDRNSRKNAINSYDTCVAAGYSVLESYPERCVIPGSKTYTRIIAQNNAISLEGKTTCLLHKRMTGPHTMECVFGIKTDKDEYYKLSSSPNDNSLSTIERRVRVSGTLKRDASTIYQSEGTITITSYKFLD